MVFTYAKDVQESGKIHALRDKEEIWALGTESQENLYPARDRKEIRAFRVRKFVSSQRQERDKRGQSQGTVSSRRLEHSESGQE